MGRLLAEAVLIGMVMFLGMHLILWRHQVSERPRLGQLGVLAIIGIGITLADIIWQAGWNTPLLIAGLWIDLFIVISYFAVYALLVRSVSITLLSRLRRAPGESVLFESLVHDYSDSAQFESRVRVMDASGFVRLSPDAVELTPRGAWVAQSARVISGAICAPLEG